MLKWQAKEFKKRQKTVSWYIGWGILSLLIIAFAVWQKSALMVIVFVLISVCVYLFAQKEPKKINFAISKKGIKIDGKLYDYDELKSFWIFYDPPSKKILSLESKKILMPYVNIPINKLNPVKLRKILLKYIPEKEHQESLIDNLPL